MAVFSKGKPIPEHEAEGGIGRIYYEIRQILRITGIPPLFCNWAACGKFLPLFWDAFQPNAETRVFEEAADRHRAEAARLVEPFGKPGLSSQVRLGESQTYHLRASLDLYYYLCPKLAVLTSAARLVLAGERVGKEETSEAERIERGAPAEMIAMELASEEMQDPRLRALFGEVKTISDLPVVSMDVRALALWPDYLNEARKRLKPIIAAAPYRQAAERLLEMSRREARDLPYSIPSLREKINAAGQNVEEVADLTARFERAYPRMILNIALLERDWKNTDALTASPFPAPPRRPAVATGGMR